MVYVYAARAVLYARHIPTLCFFGFCISCVWYNGTCVNAKAYELTARTPLNVGIFWGKKGVTVNIHRRRLMYTHSKSRHTPPQDEIEIEKKTIEIRLQMQTITRELRSQF